MYLMVNIVNKHERTLWILKLESEHIKQKNEGKMRNEAYRRTERRIVEAAQMACLIQRVMVPIL